MWCSENERQIMYIASIAQNRGFNYLLYLCAIDGEKLLLLCANKHVIVHGDAVCYGSFSSLNISHC